MILKVISANSVDPDQTSLIWVHTVCRYAKNSFEKFARIFSRRHKQTTFSDAVFLGALRINSVDREVKLQLKNKQYPFHTGTDFKLWVNNNVVIELEHDESTVLIQD